MSYPNMTDDERDQLHELIRRALPPPPPADNPCSANQSATIIRIPSNDNILSLI